MSSLREKLLTVTVVLVTGGMGTDCVGGGACFREERREEVEFGCVGSTGSADRGFAQEERPRFY